MKLSTNEDLLNKNAVNSPSPLYASANRDLNKKMSLRKIAPLKSKIVINLKVKSIIKSINDAGEEEVDDGAGRRIGGEGNDYKSLALGEIGRIKSNC